MMAGRFAMAPLRTLARAYVLASCFVAAAFYAVWGVAALLERLASGGAAGSPIQVGRVLFAFFFVAGGPISPGLIVGAVPPVVWWDRLCGAPPGLRRAPTPRTMGWALIALAVAMVCWAVVFFAVLIRPEPPLGLLAGVLAGMTLLGAGAGAVLQSLHRPAPSGLAAWVWTAPSVWVWVSATIDPAVRAGEWSRLVYLGLLSAAAYAGAAAGAGLVRAPGGARG